MLHLGFPVVLMSQDAQNFISQLQGHHQGNKNIEVILQTLITVPDITLRCHKYRESKTLCSHQVNSKRTAQLYSIA
jgi:hypothetical protein